MKLEDIFPLIYCVNLDERTDRWDDTKREFKNAKISAKRFSAIKESKGYIGCWKSHLTILKEARDKNCNVFIFEDDVQILQNEQYWIDLVLEDLDKIEWDMFYLGGNILRPFYQTTKYLARLSHCQSTHAYGVNAHILHPLIETLEKYSDNYTLHIDQVYADVIVPNIKAYISVPMLAIQRECYSDILGRTENYGLPTRRYYNYLVENRSLYV